MGNWASWLADAPPQLWIDPVGSLDWEVAT